MLVLGASFQERQGNLLPVTVSEAVSELVPTKLVALHLYVPESLGPTDRMVNCGKLLEPDSEYLEEEDEIWISDPLLDVNLQEMEVAAGEADTVHGITTLFPVIAV